MTRLGGWTIESYNVVTSTNEVARRAVDEGAADHTAFVAAEQSAGRGRGDHTWVSPPGGLYVSAVLRDVPVAIGPLLPLVAGRAVRRTLASLNPNKPTWLKWPNDVMTQPPGATSASHKVAGILVESASAGGPLQWAIIGMGINLNPEGAALPETDPPATCFANEGDGRIDLDEALDTLLDEVNEALFACGEDPAGFVASVAEGLAYRGQLVTVGSSSDGGTPVSGTLIGLTPAGHLRIETTSGLVVVAPWDASGVRLAE